MIKIANNFMMLNKIIIFIENMIEEDIDNLFFIEKINYDLHFIYQKIEEIWNDPIKYDKVYQSKNNYLNSFYYIIKRFYKIIKKIKEDEHFSSLDTYDIEDMNFLFDNTQKKLYLITQQAQRQKIKKVDKQYINEEEYNLLLFDEESFDVNE